MATVRCSERVLLQTDARIESPYQSTGTVEDWRKTVARSCIGNSRLAFGVSAGFAAPLLRIAGEENGGFHFVGSSRLGKSTLLRVAGSVWGGGGINGYLCSWRATSNGLEGVAEAHCDALLCLDEMGQVDARRQEKSPTCSPTAPARVERAAMALLDDQHNGGCWSCRVVKSPSRTR